MIWGYHYFRKHPNGGVATTSRINAYCKFKAPAFPVKVTLDLQIRVLLGKQTLGVRSCEAAMKFDQIYTPTFTIKINQT